MLAPLAKLAADHSVAVVCVTHLSKSPSNDPLARVIGSTAFGAAVRTAFLIVSDKHHPDRRLFLPLKSNISRTCPGLAFQIRTSRPPLRHRNVARSLGAKPVTITARKPSRLRRQDEIDAATETAEACLRVFDSENAPELRSSRLIELLDQHETCVSTRKI